MCLSIAIQNLKYFTWNCYVLKFPLCPSLAGPALLSFKPQLKEFFLINADMAYWPPLPFGGKNDIFVILLGQWKNVFQANRQERLNVLKEKNCTYYAFLCFLSLSDIKLEEKKKVDSQGTRSEEWSKTGQDFDENRNIGTVRS